MSINFMRGERNHRAAEARRWEATIQDLWSVVSTVIRRYVESSDWIGL